MSVINQVLKDLGERQGRSDLRLTDMLHRQSAAADLKRKRIPVASVLMILVGVLAIGILLWQRNGSPRPEIAGLFKKPAKTVQAAPVASTSQAVTAKPVVEAAVISAINIEADDDSLRLVLETDKAPANAITQVFNADGSIDYTLASARIQAAIPALKENPYISSYAVMQREQDVVVRLIPAASALAFIEPVAGDNGYRTIIGARARRTPGVVAKPELQAPQLAAPAPQAQPVQQAESTPQSESPQQAEPPRKSAMARQEQPAESAEKIEIKRRVTPAGQAETYYSQGVEKLQANRIEAAVSDLRKAVRLQPEMHVARELLAALLLRSGYSTEAYQELQEGMRLKPEHTAYARLYAQSLIETGQPAEALRVLAVSEPYAIQQPDYLALMAAVAQRLARHEESVRHYMAALALKPTRGAWWVGMAISLEALGRKPEAVQAYRTALAGSELNADLMTYARERVTQLEG